MPKSDVSDAACAYVSSEGGSEAKDPSDSSAVASLPFPKLGLTLPQIRHFIDSCGGIDALKGLNTEDVCRLHVKSTTSSLNLSYCEYLQSTHNPYPTEVKKATVFISHAWRFIFLDVIYALYFHFRNEPDVVIWFDLFSNNQTAAPNLDFLWWCTTFKSAIASFGRVILVIAPWADPIPFTRSWCLYEIFCTIDTNAIFEVAMTPTEKEIFIEAVQEDEQVVLDMIGQININRSDASSPIDKQRIFEVAQKTIGCGRLNRIIYDKLYDWIISAVTDCMEQPQIEKLAKLRLNRTLGVLLRNRGANVKQARDILEKTLEECKLFREPDDLETSTVMYHLAWLLDDQGEYDRALELYNECLHLRIAKLGDKNEKVLDTINCISIIHFNLDNPREALRKLESCYSDAVANLGPNHKNTLSVMSNLSAVLTFLRRNKDAETLMLKSLEAHKAVFKLSHPKTQHCINNLAVFYSNVGRIKESCTMHGECLEIRREKLGNDHPDTINSMYNMSTSLLEIGEMDQAKTLFFECLSRGKVSLGEDSPDYQDYKSAISHYDLNEEELAEIGY